MSLTNCNTSCMQIFCSFLYTFHSHLILWVYKMCSSLSSSCNLQRHSFNSATACVLKCCISIMFVALSFDGVFHSPTHPIHYSQRRKQAMNMLDGNKTLTTWILSLATRYWLCLFSTFRFVQRLLFSSGVWLWNGLSCAWLDLAWLDFIVLP